MASNSSIEFTDTALFCSSNSPYGLSYTDPDQKWLIRGHLVSLIQNFSSFSPSTDTFIHDNGYTVNLLNLSGHLRISPPSTPPIPLTIWLHENYPHTAPMVFITSNSTYTIHPNHPFIDLSGSIKSPYLLTWSHPRSNLLDLVQNLARLFSLHHTLWYSGSCSLSHPSLVSKMEAMDRLWISLHYDITALRGKTEQEIESLSSLQLEMVNRVDKATNTIIEFEREKMNLDRRVMDLREEADVLINWLRVFGVSYHGAGVGTEVDDDAFEGVNEEEKVVIDCLAADKGLEDLMYALEQALQKGVVSIEVYVKEVRKSAREQFYHKAMVVKLKGTKMLTWPN